MSDLSISETRAERMETKLDHLLTEVTKLTALHHERQIETGRRIGLLEDRLAKQETSFQDYKTYATAEFTRLDAEISRWKNYGFGAWAVVLALYTLYTTFFKH